MRHDNGMELDALMNERGIGALIVPMHEAVHPAFRWMTRGAKVTKGYAVKVAGKEPLLIAYPMEREEAAASGVATKLIHDFDHERIFRNATSTPAAYGEFFDRVLRDSGVDGVVAFVGNIPFQLYLPVTGELEQRGWRVHRGAGEDLIQLARKTKAPWEVEAIRSVGERTEQVVDGVRALLREAEGGRAMRIGDLKAFISSEIARRGMVEDHETIVSQGRDAGVPHSRGDAAAPLRLSVPLVVDMFPVDKTTGYFFDLTRTFCIGRVPDELRLVHTRVKDAFFAAAEAMKPGTPASSYQALVCDRFEADGYATLRSNPATHEGYVHSLGHGVGLEIHEKPFFALTPLNRDMIEEGDVLTIEPGLYFPDREIGVRIEDTFVVRADGVETLARSSRELEP